MPTLRISRRQAQGLTGRRRNVSAAGQRTAQAEGWAFQERAISHAYTCGLTLFEIPSGCKWLRGGRAVPRPTPFDVFGAIPWEGGRLICFDAKRRGERSAGSGFDLREHAEAHQLNALRGAGEAGAVSGLLIECGPRGDVRWLNWRELHRPGNVVPWDDLSRWHIVNPINDRINFPMLISMFSVAYAPRAG